MANLLLRSFEIFSKHINLSILFSIPFLIAILIPLLAPFPSFITMGSVLIRKEYVQININQEYLSIIAISSIISSLFLSFSIVLINMIAKSERSGQAIKRRDFSKIEAYTSRVFAIVLLFLFIFLASEIAFSYIGKSYVSFVISIAIFPFFFYAPSGIVIEEKPILKAMEESFALVLKRPSNFIIWLIVALLLLTSTDFLVSLAYPYMGFDYEIGELIELIIASLIIIPYITLYQATAYLDKYKFLKYS
ncbi:MAG: hypothetical protein QXL16_02125 [Candidatus Micrarchaeaceae archaeon]